MQIPMTITPAILQQALLQYLMNQGVATIHHQVVLVKMHRNRGGVVQAIDVIVDTGDNR